MPDRRRASRGRLHLQDRSRSLQRIRDHGDPAIFISLRDEAEAIAEAEALTAKGNTSLPLFGVPFAVKDNIDVAGLADHRGLPGVRVHAGAGRQPVARLIDAGAIVIGKTNLDQFATGLVGVRSPYGIPQQPVIRDLVSGGSVRARRLRSRRARPLALGTDTAGSGRVPAMFNNIVGLKPTSGCVDRRRRAGLPHARLRLDLRAHRRRRLTRFTSWPATTTPIPFARPRFGPVTGFPAGIRLGVPRKGQLQFFGDTGAEACATRRSRASQTLGGTPVESISSRSTRPRGCSTKARGWRSAIR